MECSFEGCDREAAKRGWCRTHYMQWRRTGTVFPIGSNPNRGRKTCEFDGCERLVHAYGLCGAHAKQKRLGMELRPIREARPDDQEGFRWCSTCKQYKESYLFPRPGGSKREPRTCDDCRRDFMRDYNARPEAQMKRRWARATKKYGITQQDYETLWARSDGKCEICGTELQNILSTEEDLRYKSAIDHNHETGAVRGLLCGACNCAIGYMQDSPERLVAAAHYLAQHGH